MQPSRGARWEKILLGFVISVCAALVLIGLPLALVVSDQIGQGLTLGDRAVWITAGATASLGIAALAAVGAAVAAFSAQSAGRRSQCTAELDLLLRLDERFRYSEFADVSVNLQEGGRWVTTATEGVEPGPENDEDWRRVTAYVRLFEPIYFVAREGNTPSDVLRSTFGYRIDRVVRNRKIVRQMISNSSETPWLHFVKLWQIVDADSHAHWTEFLKLWQVVDEEGYKRLNESATSRPIPMWQR